MEDLQGRELCPPSVTVESLANPPPEVRGEGCGRGAGCRGTRVPPPLPRPPRSSSWTARPRTSRRHTAASSARRGTRRRVSGCCCCWLHVERASAGLQVCDSHSSPPQIVWKSYNIGSCFSAAYETCPPVQNITPRAEWKLLTWSPPPPPPLTACQAAHVAGAEAPRIPGISVGVLSHEAVTLFQSLVSYETNGLLATVDEMLIYVRLREGARWGGSTRGPDLRSPPAAEQPQR